MLFCWQNNMDGVGMNRQGASAGPRPGAGEMTMPAVDDLFAQLQPFAAATYANYCLARTPPSRQWAMRALVNPALSRPLVPAANKALVTHGASVVVQDNGGGADAKTPGLANVNLSTLNHVRLAA